MRVLKSMLAAFATFSRIPMPMVELDSEDCKYSLCFFPLVGLVIGLSEALLYYLAKGVDASNLLRSAVMTAVPLLLTGGIHMDGFCDTSDAFNSYQPKERKLEILKDPHIGAFGAIRIVMWMIVYCGLMSNIKNVWYLVATFVISRALTALTVVLFRNAKETGMGASEKNMSHKKAVIAASIAWLVVGAGILAMGAVMDIHAGGSAVVAILIVAITLVVAGLCCYRYKCLVYFELGGFTGDTSGWHLMVSEFMQAGCIAVITLFSVLF